MTTEELPDHRYIDTSETNLIGRIVFVRDSTDVGDETWWREATLLEVEPERGEISKKPQKRGRFTALLENGRTESFQWCVIPTGEHRRKKHRDLDEPWLV